MTPATTTPPAPVRVLFFDIGNVLVSDDPSGLFIFRRLYDSLPAESRGTPDEFFARRTRHIAAGGDLWSFIREILPEAEFETFRTNTRRDLYDRWEEHSPEIPGMANALQALASRYRLGILANQPLQIEPLLRNRGLWDLFEVHGISAQLGMEKPDPAMFHWALERVGLPAAQCMMIGDRIDNDIAPAKALGFRTLHLILDAEQRAWQPEDEFGRAYMRSAIAASRSGAPPASQSEKPDLTATSPEQLVTLLTT